MRIIRYIAAFLIIVSWGCDRGSSSDIQADVVEDIVPSKVSIFAIGDSLTAGTQDAATLDATQKASWITLFADQMAKLTEVDYAYPALNADGTRIDATVKPTNVAIPGLEMREALEERGTISLLEGVPVDIPSFVEPLGELTPIEALATSLEVYDDPDAERWVFVWIGSNDAFFDVTAADRITEEVLAERTPDTETFAKRLAALLEGIAGHDIDELFILPIPNLLDCGFLLSPEDLAFLLSDDAPVEMFEETDRIALTAASEVIASHTMFNLPARNLLEGIDESEIVDRDEQELMTARIAAYNEKLRDVADEYGATVLNATSKLNEWLAKGTVLGDGRQVTRSWSRGGMFSLDGVHPSHTGHALIANAVIDEINDLMAINIPRVDVVAVHAQDPYRDGDGDGWVAGPTWEATPGTPASLLRLFVDDDDSTDASKASKARTSQQ